MTIQLEHSVSEEEKKATTCDKTISTTVRNRNSSSNATNWKSTPF